MTTGPSRWIFWLSCAIIASVLTINGLVLLLGVPGTVPGEVVGRILGTLDAVLMTVVFYLWGSSQGSKDKDVGRI